jgi:hypothetical protein
VVLRFGSPFTPCSCEHGVACFDGLAYVAELVLEALVADISVASEWYKGCVGLSLKVCGV